MTMARTIKLYALPDAPITRGLRPLRDTDVPSACEQVLYQHVCEPAPHPLPPPARPTPPHPAPLHPASPLSTHPSPPHPALLLISTFAAIGPAIDIDFCHWQLNKFLATFKLAPQLTPAEFRHWLIEKPGVVYSYVVEDPNEPGRLTDLISFYALPRLLAVASTPPIHILNHAPRLQ